MANKKVGALIKAHCSRQGVKQNELAQLMNEKATTWSYKERHGILSEKEIRKVAKHLRLNDVQLKQLLAEAGKDQSVTIHDSIEFLVHAVIRSETIGLGILSGLAELLEFTRNYNDAQKAKSKGKGRTVKEIAEELTALAHKESGRRLSEFEHKQDGVSA